MKQKFKRHPLKNFFMMTRLQWAHIVKVTLTSMVISFVSLLLVGLVYHWKFKTGYFYYMTEDLDADLIRHNIWGLIIPSLIPAFFISLFLGIGASLYSSRKIALPLFKMRKWAEDLFAGNLNHTVYVRQSDKMSELPTTCNQIARRYLQLFKKVQAIAENEEESGERRIVELKRFLSTLRL